VPMVSEIATQPSSASRSGPLSAPLARIAGLALIAIIGTRPGWAGAD
jgi:hypothetical protein